MRGASGSMLVAVRVRPLNARYKATSLLNSIKVLEGSLLVLIDPSDVLKHNDLFQKNRSK